MSPRTSMKCSNCSYSSKTTFQYCPKCGFEVYQEPKCTTCGEIMYEGTISTSSRTQWVSSRSSSWKETIQDQKPGWETVRKGYNIQAFRCRVCGRIEILNKKV